MAKRTSHGGNRPGSGRKPVDDKAVKFWPYPKQSRIDKIGKERAREICLKAIEKEYLKLVR